MQTGPLQPTGQAMTLLVSGRDALTLRAGDIVQAEVLAMAADGSASIRLNNQVLSVRSEVALQRGALLQLRVEKEESTVYLRLAGAGPSGVDPSRSAAQSLLKGLADLGPAAESLDRLTALLRAIPGQMRDKLPGIGLIERFQVPVEQVTAGALKDAVQNGGVFFESKLRVLVQGFESEGSLVNVETGRIIGNDLKAALLGLKDAFLQPRVVERLRADGMSMDRLIGAVNDVVRNIEFYQLQSRVTDTLQFFLPLLWKDLKEGEVIMRESDRGGAGERSYSCSVLLDLERAGRVRATLLLQSGHLHVTCAAENRDFLRALNDGAPALTERFAAAGLRVAHLAIRHQETIDFGVHRGEGLSIRA